MAITRITLKGPSGEDEVLKYNLKFFQENNTKTGEPTSEPYLGSLKIKLIRSGDGDCGFYVGWQNDAAKKHTVDLCFYENKRLVRSCKILDCYLTNYTQAYIKDPNDGGRIIETLYLSPLSIEVDGVRFKRNKKAN